MPYKPDEHACKTATIDRRYDQRQQQLQSVRPVKNSRIQKLDNVGIKKG
jgi:hypothetical protein